MSQSLDERLGYILLEGHFKDDIPLTLKAIKQAFQDANYVQIPHVNQDADDTIRVNGKPVMTGQEWLKRFEEEFDQLQNNSTDYQIYKAAKRASGVEGSEHDDIGLGHGELGEVAQEG